MLPQVFQKIAALLKKVPASLICVSLQETCLLTWGILSQKCVSPWINLAWWRQSFPQRHCYFRWAPFLPWPKFLSVSPSAKSEDLPFSHFPATRYPLLSFIPFRTSWGSKCPRQWLKMRWGPQEWDPWSCSVRSYWVLTCVVCGRILGSCRGMSD